jgi:hypothetical protein
LPQNKNRQEEWLKDASGEDQGLQELRRDSERGGTAFEWTLEDE